MAKRLPALALAALLALTALCACGEDKAARQAEAAARFEEVLADPWYLTDDSPVTFTGEVSDTFRKNGGFQFERAEAQKVFGGRKVRVAKSRRNELVERHGRWVFDRDAGTGVFLVNEPALSGMHHGGFYIEFSSDKGRTWKIADGCYQSAFSVTDVRLRGKRVYLLLSSSVESKSVVLYSDDLCRTFYLRDLITLLPDYAELLYRHTADARIIGFGQEDASLTVGWYDGAYSPDADDGQYRYFLTAAFSADLTKGTVHDADDDYIRKTAVRVPLPDERAN